MFEDVGQHLQHVRMVNEELSNSLAVLVSPAPALLQESQGTCSQSKLGIGLREYVQKMTVLIILIPRFSIIYCQARLGLRASCTSYHIFP